MSLDLEKEGHIIMDKKYIVIDLETTGQSSEQEDRIIEIGIVVIEKDEITTTFSTFVHPEKDIPSFITNLTSISNEDVKDAPLFKEIGEKLLTYFKDGYFVAHNVPFDLRFLNNELEQNNFKPLKNQTLDTVELSRIFFPQAPSYRLNELANYLHITHENPHRALDDALVTAEIFLKVKKKLSNLPYETVNHLIKLEKYFHSDLFDLFNHYLQEAAFQQEPDPNMNTFQGISFKKLPNLEEEIHSNTNLSFGHLLEKTYKKNGLLQKVFNNYEFRSGQKEISELIFDSFINKNHALIEAGTGLGKTISYLIPAVFYAVHENERIVLSTYTTQLQAQIMNDEIPLLKQMMPFTFTASILKGQSHYLSLERFYYELQHETIENNYDIALTKAKILVWITETETGDIDEINLSKAGYYFFQKINTKAENQIDPKSPWFAYSYYMHAKQKAQKANIIVTNHALLCTDLYNDYQVIPSYKYIVIDEAHHFEHAVSEQSALKLNNNTLQYHLNQLGRSDATKFIRPVIPKSSELLSKWDELLEQVKNQTMDLFQAIHTYVTQKRQFKTGLSDQGRTQFRITKDVELHTTWHKIQEIAKNVTFYINELLHFLKKVFSNIDIMEFSDEQITKHIKYYVDTFANYHETLREFFLNHNELSEVKWVEIEGHEKVFLYQKRVQVSSYLKEYFFKKKQSVILTSATLTMRNSFSHLLRQLGLETDERVLTKQFPSPFQYEKQVKFMVPNDFPHIRTDEEQFIFATCEAISSIVEITKGRMLVLFTSYKMLRKCYYLLQEIIDIDEYMIIAQGITSGSRMRLKKNFQSFDKSILLGTSSFWEGIDIPGEDLSSLVIVRLPFQPPNHPTYEAKANLLEKDGKNAFLNLALPDAVIRFKQGFGRLIRSQKDRGVIFVCDSRLMTARYRSFFLESIPDIKIHYESTSLLMDKLHNWF